MRYRDVSLEFALKLQGDRNRDRIITSHPSTIGPTNIPSTIGPTNIPSTIGTTNVPTKYEKKPSSKHKVDG